MKKTVIALLMALTLNASELNWFESFNEASKIAQSEQKPMMLFMNKPGCGSCAYMKENVFTDEKVISYLEKHFISVSLNIHSNDAPEPLQSSVTPVFHFVTHDGTKLQDSLIGGKTAPFFLKLLKKAEAASK